MQISGPTIRALVTGGAGFIGSHLTDHLARLGCRVTVLDNLVNGRRENLAEALSTGRVELVVGDITDAATCERIVPGHDVVFHLACLGVRASLHDPFSNHQVNALGSLNLLAAARRAGTPRFVYVSTSEVYGKALTFPLTESATTWPTTVYGGSKLAGEHYAAAYHECYGLPVIRIRPFNNYGPRAHFEGDSGEVIPRFMLRALAGQAPVVFGDGSHTRERSLRMRSTIMTFSARSLASVRSSSARARSTASSAARRRVPLMGCVCTWPSRTVRKRSGETLASATPPWRRNPAWCDPDARRSRRNTSSASIAAGTVKRVVRHSW